jgi:hypothetical protein
MPQCTNTIRRRQVNVEKWRTWWWLNKSRHVEIWWMYTNVSILLLVVTKKEQRNFIQNRTLRYDISSHYENFKSNFLCMVYNFFSMCWFLLSYWPIRPWYLLSSFSFVYNFTICAPQLQPHWMHSCHHIIVAFALHSCMANNTFSSA